MDAANGRDTSGRFARGNPGGPGNPHGQRTAALRAALLDAVTPEDLRAVTAKLVSMAKAGDVQAAKEVLDRCLGKPPAAVAVDVGRGVDTFVAERIVDLSDAQLLAIAAGSGRAV